MSADDDKKKDIRPPTPGPEPKADDQDQDKKDKEPTTSKVPVN